MTVSAKGRYALRVRQGFYETLRAYYFRHHPGGPDPKKIMIFFAFSY